MSARASFNSRGVVGDITFTEISGTRNIHITVSLRGLTGVVMSISRCTFHVLVEYWPTYFKLLNTVHVSHLLISSEAKESTNVIHSSYKYY